MKRRHFLKTLSAGLAVPYLIPRSVLAAPGVPGANDRVAVAVIGCGNRVCTILNEAPPELRVAALADCDLRQMSGESNFGKRVSKMEHLADGFSKWPRYQDYRQMFDKEKLDGVIVTTTTHARALIAIHAAQAGLDLYVEKPVTLTIEEGQVLVKAVRKHQRVAQAGTQARSMILDKWAYEHIRAGLLGKMQKVVANNFIGPVQRTPTAGEPTPSEINWDMWCNQTPLVPYDSKELHPGCGRWGKWWDYDGGGLSWGVTGWGAHSYDMVQACLGTDYTGPVEVWAETPADPMSPVTMRYANGVVLEMKLPLKHGPVWGAIFIGEKGKIETNRNKCVSNPPELVADKPEANYEWGVTRPHLENWIGCMRSRKRPNADIEIAHRSTTLCHLANIARQLGRRLQWNPDAEAFIGDDEANRLRSRPRRKGYELPTIA